MACIDISMMSQPTNAYYPIKRSKAYKYMAKRHWNLGIIRLFNDVLYEEALAHTPNGLRYHLIDICVEELAKVNKDAGLPLTEATFLDCLEPFFALAQKAADKNVHRRVMNSVFLKFLSEYSFVSDVAVAEDDEDNVDEKTLIFGQVHVGSVAKFIFEIASDNDTDERFRKALYEMHKSFVRQIRTAGRDVDLNDLDEDYEEDDCCANNACQEGTCNKTEAAENVLADEEHPQESKKSKKKKSKSKDGKSKEEDVPETPKDEPNDEVELVPATKSSKKKRKERESKAKAASESKEPVAPTPTPKKKKKKQQSPPSVDPRAMIDSDGVDNLNPTNTFSPPNSDDEGQSSDSAKRRRVSFGKMNHCKGHKASMKALKTLKQEVWSTANRTPEKGILREATSSVKKSKKKSKK